jgi:hypothetical protein
MEGKMGGIQSWDDIEPEERDYFIDSHKKGIQERDLPGFQRNLEETMKELERTRFAEVLTILIEKGRFQ